MFGLARVMCNKYETIDKYSDSRVVICDAFSVCAKTTRDVTWQKSLPRDQNQICT